MKWGEAQAIFQLIIGLNIAFYGFKEIRKPVEEKERRELSRLSDAITREISAAQDPVEKDKVQKLRLQLIPIYNNVRAIRKSTDFFENVIENLALAFIVLETVDLFRSAYQYNTVMDSSEQILLYLGFLPPFGAIIMNLFIIGRTNREMKRPRLKLAEELDRI